MENEIPSTTAKELTPEQEAELKEKRAKFRLVYEKLKDLNPNDAYDLMCEMVSNIQDSLRKEAESRKLSVLTVLPATLNDGAHAGLSEEIYGIMMDQSIAEASNWLGSHGNRINATGRMKLNDIKVSDLGIEKYLLS